MALFGRRHIQINFLALELLYFDTNFTEINSQWSTYFQQASISLDNGLVSAKPLTDSMTAGYSDSCKRHSA